MSYPTANMASILCRVMTSTPPRALWSLQVAHQRSDGQTPLRTGLLPDPDGSSFRMRGIQEVRVPRVPGRCADHGRSTCGVGSISGVGPSQSTLGADSGP